MFSRDGLRKFNQILDSKDESKIRQLIEELSFESSDKNVEFCHETVDYEVPCKKCIHLHADINLLMLLIRAYAVLK